MIHGSIGIIVGLVMGVTGAGGAIISIPLFQLLLRSSLKEATVLSLLAVLFGTGINLIGKFTRVKWNLGIGLALSGTASNFASLGLKPYIPNLMIVFMLLLIGLFSIWNVWSTQENSGLAAKSIGYAKIIITGLVLGVVTTITGLGGGVLLIPIFLKVFHLNYEDALPTSLVTIFFISFSALIFQRNTALTLIDVSEALSLGAGATFSYLTLRLTLKRLTAEKLLKLRKVIFTTVTFASLAGVVYKSFQG